MPDVHFIVRLTGLDVNLPECPAMFISPTEAVKIYDVSKPTLYADMNGGTISYEVEKRRSGGKKRKINVAELDRVYKKREEKEEILTSKNVQSGQKNTEINGNNDNAEVRLLNQQIEFLKEKIEASELESEKWEEAFKKAQATADKITALLEDKSSNSHNNVSQETNEKIAKLLEMQIERGEQDKKLAALEKSLSDMRKQNQSMFRQLKEERSKGFFKKLFG